MANVIPITKEENNAENPSFGGGHAPL